MDKHAGVVRAATFVQEDPNVEGRYIRKVFPVACDTTKDECLKGAWRDLVPNTKYKSVSYFEDDGASFLKKDGNQIWFKARLRYVCWLNLPAMGKTSCSISSAIVASIIGAMPDQPFNSGNFTRIRITPVGEAPKNAAIFAKYTYDEAALQYLLGPYDYFSLLFEVEYAIDKRCLDTYQISDPELCDTQQDTDPEPEPPVMSFCERVMACDSIQELVERIEELEEGGDALTCATLADCNTFQQLEARVSNIEDYTTDEIEEGSSNFYYTQARFNTSFAAKSTTDLAEGTNLYYTLARFNTAFATKSTSDLTEGTNLYYTAARFNSAFGAKTTSDLAEGSNLYYTQARFDSAFAANNTDDLTEGSTNFYWTQTRFDSAFGVAIGTLTTDDINEGSVNLYYTDGRADARIALQKGAANGIVPLDGSSKIASIYLPAIAITETQVVGSQVAMLALTAQTGDVAVRTDLNKSYILAGTNPSVLSDWQELLTPTDAVLSVNGQTGIVSLTTTNIAEGTNLYWTQGRFDSAFTAKSTTDLSEGINLYYTQGRFDSAFALKSTSDLSEGSNLYYTDARARASISDTVLGLTYTPATGVLSLDAGYEIPTTAQLSGYVSGSGVNNQIALWSGTSTQDGDANFTWDGSSLLVGGASVVGVENWSFQRNGNSLSRLQISNTTSGNQGRSSFFVTADLGTGFVVNVLSSLYTPSASLLPNSVSLLSNMGGGMQIGNTTASSLTFWTTNTQVAELNSGGFFAIGTAAVTNAPITTSFSLNGASISRFINTSATSAASSQIGVRNNSSIDVLMGIRSSSFTTAGLVVANQGQFIGGASIVSMLYGTTASGDSIFIRGGSATTDEVGRFSSTGFQTANSKTIGINTAAVALQYITASLSNNSQIFAQFSNTSNGNAAISGLVVTNDASASIGIQKFGTGYSTAGLIVASLARLFTGTGNILIGPTGSTTNIQFATSGTAASNLRLTIDDTSLTLADSINFVFNATTGSKIGTATSQKFAFWNKTPIVQPSSANQAALTNSTGGAYDGTLVDVTTLGASDPAKVNANFTDMWTLQNEMRNVLVNLGLMKGAA